MFTNTYLPHVGGVARSVRTLEEALRREGHEVRVIAPEFEGADECPDVLRVPAIQHFNGSDFSLRIPFPNLVRDFMEDFQPDLIHSHHPFLLGDAALRESWKMRVPVIFTHHTLYERYTRYVPLDSEALRRMAVQLATDYCNLCDLVIAPSESIARLLADRGVTTRLETVPTGIDATAFASGNGSRYRMDAKIPESAPVIGHIGRLAGEKNLAYLAEAVMEAMRGHPDSHFLLVGDGDAREEMVSSFENAGLSERLHAPGKQMGRELADAYAAMDCFVFASQTETQGIVLAEAMAAGAPVIALDGSGVREIVDDGVNGRLLSAGASSADFSAAIIRLLEDPDCRRSMSERAKESARRYDTATCTRRMLGHYAALLAEHRLDPPHDATAWDRMIAGIEIEWELLAAKVSAVTAAVVQTPATEASFD